MAIEDLPRPWVLAALTGLKMTELVALPEHERSSRQGERPLPRVKPWPGRRREAGQERGRAVLVKGGLN